MATAHSSPRYESLADPAFKTLLQELRQTDNWRNWYYLVRTYALLAIVVGGTIWFYQQTRASNFWLLWNVPVFAVAIMIVGALQHQMATLAHEAVHHTLFRNRYLNDFVSEWLCSFPMFSSTFHYGLHHLAHHQFVNDPVRDPDISQMQMSGHRLSFPVVKEEFFDVLLRQMWVPNLIRYSLARAEYDSLGTEHNPYIREDWEFSKLPARLTLVHMVVTALLLTGLVIFSSPLLLALLPVAVWAATMIALGLLPERYYYQSKIRPIVSIRALAMMRGTFLTLMFSALAWATWATGDWWASYFFFLWVLPLGTSFPLYMVLRQIVQHGNGDRGWLTNSRVFLCHPFINFAVFPLGQDYHLPHHMFSTIPHYRLKSLHEAMLDCAEYRDQATVVEGYFWPKERPPVHPTVVDVLGPAYAPREFRDVYIDNAVLEGRNVTDEEKRQILDEAAREAERARREAHVGSWSVTGQRANKHSDVA
ncbi:MAG: fatty acid desaturase [Planctomycetes bacterium]|nr:fatty acid desaturase [Planctomycetota bacterium]